MNTYIVIATILFIIVSVGLFFIVSKQKNATNTTTISATKITYVALGDSYTIGEGVSVQDRWPNLLVAQLKLKGINIELVENPSVTGFTTQDVINRELAVMENADPTFVTLLIGANDLVQGVSKEAYRQNLITILDRIQTVLPEKENIVLVTIPDFSKTPVGKRFGNEKELSESIENFNTILKDTGSARGLVVVDIFPTSQKAATISSYLVSDGLHPSSEQYADWVELILPQAFRLLSKNE